ncbi:MAG: glucose/mannose transport system substrate-binding protein [Kosmotogales bacterium]|nr:glucose/mannose transport system substrate-binding protein [Kosmotogales bacterium]
MKKLLVFFSVILFATSFMFAAGQVEIFSWWTGGGEEEGLNALIELFNEWYPDVNVINATVAGGAGTNAKAVLKTRMLGGNPPDSFQVHAGEELTDTYVITGLMEPITDLLAEWGISDKFPEDILSICSYGGEVYSIPVNVHRGNVIFANNAILEEAGVDSIPLDWDGFFAALDKIKEAGYVPLALGDKNKWPATHLFEDVLASTLGPDGYKGLWDGSVSFDDPKVVEAVEIFGRLMDYVNEDHAAGTWQDATLMVQDGRAAMNVMGDWAEGYLKTLGWTPGVEFDWSVVPGNEGIFMVVSDTFGLPKGAPDAENAKKWLKLVSSVEGQDTFNPIKGSIPARVDADKSLYDVYLTWSMDDFATNALLPSIAHGSAAPEGFITALNDVINAYVTDRNVEKCVDGIIEAAEDNL